MENLGKKEHWKKGKYTIINYIYMYVLTKRPQFSMVYSLIDHLRS